MMAQDHDIYGPVKTMRLIADDEADISPERWLRAQSSNSLQDLYEVATNICCVEARHYKSGTILWDLERPPWRIRWNMKLKPGLYRMIPSTRNSPNPQIS